MTVTSALGPLAHEASVSAVDFDAGAHEDDAPALGDIGSLRHRTAAALADLR
jgi:hypothetical protein